MSRPARAPACRCVRSPSGGLRSRGRSQKHRPERASGEHGGPGEVVERRVQRDQPMGAPGQGLAGEEVRGGDQAHPPAISAVTAGIARVVR